MRKSGVAGAVMAALVATLAVAVPATVAVADPGDTTIVVTARAGSGGPILTDGCVRLRNATTREVVSENCTPTGDSYVFTVDPVAVSYDAQSIGFLGYLDNESVFPVTAVPGEASALEVIVGSAVYITARVIPPAGAAWSTRVCASAVDKNGDAVATACGAKQSQSSAYAELKIPVHPGVYRLKYFAEDGSAAAGWWGGSHFGSARELEVKTSGMHRPATAGFPLVPGATLSGTITDAEGAPASGQCLQLGTTVPAYVDAVCADDDGLWSITELPAGEYVIFFPDEEGAVGQWAGGMSAATAQRWTVPQGGSVTADVQLLALATIEGDVTDASGHPAVDGCVSAYRSPSVSYVGYACADPLGHFSIDVLPGEYLLRYEDFVDQSATPLPAVWNGGGATWNGAPAIAVDTSAAGDGSIQLEGLGAVVTLNPLVDLGDPAGTAPATGGCVDAVSADGWYAGSACDRGLGVVTFSLPPGDYKFSASGFVYDQSWDIQKYPIDLGNAWVANTWSGGSLFFDEAEWVTVPNSGAIMETLSLVPGKRLEGKAVVYTTPYSSQPATSGYMVASDAETGDAVSSTPIHPDGRYTFAPLPLTQNVRLAIDESPGVPFQFIGNYNNYRALLWAEATVFTVGTATFRDARVDVAGTIAGRLNVPPHFADGEVCADLWYSTTNPDDAIYIDSRCGERHSDFEFADLPHGDYYISFADFEHGEWYSKTSPSDYRNPGVNPAKLTLPVGGHVDVVRLTAETSPDTPYLYTYPVKVKLTMWPPINETVTSYTYQGRGLAPVTVNEPISFVNGEAEITVDPEHVNDPQIRFTYSGGSITSNYFRLDKYRPTFTVAPVSPAVPGQTVELAFTLEISATDPVGVIFREPGGPWTYYSTAQMIDGSGTFAVFARSYPVEYYFSIRGVDSNIVSVGPDAPHVERIGGETRYEVAAGIGTKYFPDGASTVYIATGANFPDALGAAPAAALQAAPLLLVEPNNIPYAVRFELERLGPDRIVVTGGPASVSNAVLAQLEEYAPTVMRINGNDRYEVSRLVTRDAFEDVGSEIAYIATGATFPDALSASAAAGSVQAPVILLYGAASTLDAETKQLLLDLGVNEIRITGGPASVSPGIETALRQIPGVTTVTRLTGEDRFIVSGATNRAAFTQADIVFIASGYTFPDALAGAPVAGALGAPLYVIPSKCIPSYVLEDIANLGAEEVMIFGGPGSVTPEAAALRRC